MGYCSVLIPVHCSRKKLHDEMMKKGGCNEKDHGLGFTASNNSLVLEKKNFVPEKDLYILVFGEFERRPMKSSENWLNPSFNASASDFSGVLPWYSTVKLTEASLEGRSAGDNHHPSSDLLISSFLRC